jgi:hypothetical protein
MCNKTGYNERLFTRDRKNVCGMKFFLPSQGLRCLAISLSPTNTSGLPTFNHPKLEVCYSISKSSLLHCNFLNEDLAAIFLANTEFSETLDFNILVPGSFDIGFRPVIRATDICMIVPTRKTFFPLQKSCFPLMLLLGKWLFSYVGFLSTE